MKYSPEDTRRIEALLRAFGDLIPSQMKFDILHSDKSGYIYLTADITGRYIAELIESPAQLADILVMETIDYVVRQHRPDGRRGGITQEEWLDILERIDLCRERLEEKDQHYAVDALSRYRAVQEGGRSLENARLSGGNHTVRGMTI